MGRLLDLLHIADSAFPVGAHAHSYGLETLVRRGEVADAAALRELLRAQLAVTLATTDLVALRWAHELAQAHDVAALARLDAELSALKAVREWREASLGTGRRLLATARSFLGATLLDEVASLANAGAIGPHHAPAYGLAGCCLGIDADDLASAFAFTAMVAQVSAAVRLIPLGQMAAQRTLHDLKADIDAAVRLSATHPRDDMGGSLPLLEIAGMLHEHAPARLFIS